MVISTGILTSTLLLCFSVPNFDTPSKAYKNGDCAADFSLLNLPKGKSLGRSKPAPNS